MEWKRSGGCKEYVNYGSWSDHCSKRHLAQGSDAEERNKIDDDNKEFDATLKMNNPEWGIRDLRDLEAEASRSEIILEKVVDLPANNKLVIWKKEGISPRASM